MLLGNVLHWDVGYLGRQHPGAARPAPGFARKVKPLVRLGEREMAAYCVLRGIDYQVEECPMAVGNRHLGYKEMLNQLEERSPGHQGRVPRRASWSRGHDAFADRGRRGTRRAAGRAASAARRPPPSGARSAALRAKASAHEPVVARVELRGAS